MLWIGAGIRRSVLNVGLSSTTLDPQGSMEETKALFPTLHAAVDTDLGAGFRAGVDLLGAPVAAPVFFHRPSLGRFIQGRASLTWRLAEFLAVDVGVDALWLYQDSKAREPDQHYAVNRVELLLLGPSIGLRISF